MKWETPEKVIIAVTMAIMCFALLGIVVIGCTGAAYLVWADQQERQAQLDSPLPPPLPTPVLPTDVARPEVQTEIVGLWVRVDDGSNSLAMFAPLGPEGYGIFHSSISGEGAWFTGRGETVYLVTEYVGLSQWVVTFSGETETTMTLQGPNGTQTWRKIAALT